MATDTSFERQEYLAWQRAQQNKGVDHTNRHTWRRIFHGQPIMLRWQGFSSNTHQLESNGWEILAEEHQDVYHDGYVVRIGCHSPDKKCLLSGQFVLHHGEILGGGMADGQYGTMGQLLFHRGLDLESYTFKDVYRTIEMPDFKSLDSLRRIHPDRPVDVNMNTFDYKKLRCFEYFPNDEQEIFIQPASVDEMLNMILKIQHPEQEKLKQSLILPDKKPIIQARVFSIAS